MGNQGNNDTPTDDLNQQKSTNITPPDDKSKIITTAPTTDVNNTSNSPRDMANNSNTVQDSKINLLRSLSENNDDLNPKPDSDSNVKSFNISNSSEFLIMMLHLQKLLNL